MPDRSDYVYEAKLAEQAERYDDMVTAMEEIVKMDDDLTVEERNLLSVAYKNVIGARRASWRIISSIEQKNYQAAKNDDETAQKKHNMAVEYRKKVESELNNTCSNILDALDKYLIPRAVEADSIVFYYKMKGDYYRYLAEFKNEDDRKAAAAKSLEAYESANDKAVNQLPTTHPIRLGLALNFSVFHYEIMKSPDKACSLAKKAFDSAISDLDNLGEDSYKDSTLIMQLLRDNLTLWTTDQDATAEDDAVDKGEDEDDVQQEAS